MRFWFKTNNPQGCQVILSSITISDINEFFSKNVEEKRKMRGENRFLAPQNFWEFQVDMFFIPNNDLENQKFRIGMICIDI